jgi:tRNA(fMet)-specific endonuclease VapC
MIYQLDTDHVSLLQRQGAIGSPLEERLSRLAPDDYGTAVISYEEQFQGWAAQIARARTGAERLEAYAQLKANLRYFCGIAVWDYTPVAEAIFTRLKGAKLHVGTKDLRIAAIALANDATLLSRNLRDFSRIPGLDVEDWTV